MRSVKETYCKQPIEDKRYTDYRECCRDRLLATSSIHTYVKRDLYIQNEKCKRVLLKTRDPLTIENCLS